VPSGPRLASIRGGTYRSPDQRSRQERGLHHHAMARQRTPHYSLPLGELMRRTLAMYGKHLGPYLLLAVAVFSPLLVLSLLLHLQVGTAEDLRPHGGTGRESLLAEGAQMMAVNFGVMALQSILALLFGGLISFGVVQDLRGEATSVGRSVAQGWRSMSTLLPTSIVGGLRIALGLALCLVPGIFETCRLFVAMPASVMERTGVGKSIDRSIRLTSGHRWAIFGAWFFFMGLQFLANAVAGVWASSAQRFDFILSDGFFWGAYAVNIILLTVFATAGSVAYFLLRTGKENPDVEQLAAVFD
jgi:hypothetical protein